MMSRVIAKLVFSLFWSTHVVELFCSKQYLDTAPSNVPRLNATKTNSSKQLMRHRQTFYKKNEANILHQKHTS